MICEICNKEYIPYREGRKQRFCSPKCRKRYHTLYTIEYRKRLSEKDIQKRKKKALEYYHKHKDKINQMRRKQSKENPEKFRIIGRTNYLKNKKRYKVYTKKWREENPERYKALILIQRKLKIPKGQICQICKDALATQRHHKDYSKPYKIIFCCKPCHSILDKERRKKEERNK